MRRRHLWTIALLSVTLISLEVLWTRIFSAEYFDTIACPRLVDALAGFGPQPRLVAAAVVLFPMDPSWLQTLSPVNPQESGEL